VVDREMRKSIFETAWYQTIEQRICDTLNAEKGYLSASTAKSPRAVGDAIQDILGDRFLSLIGADVCKKYSADFARRAMADLAFEDCEGFYYVVDVKTHRLSTAFNMPNLTSVDRLARFYESDDNFFVVLMVVYDLKGLDVLVERVHFVSIEFLKWDCLTIGALGWGQVQIANSNRILIDSSKSRKDWMLQMCDILIDEFYPRELGKIDKRIDRFRKLKLFWEQHA
jgi:hypothetical protein